VIKWILCLIGGIPLLQTLSITFTGAPIPFGKINFPPKSLQDLIKSIKENIQNGKNWTNALKDKFFNPQQNGLDAAGEQLRKWTDNNFQGFRESLPALFQNNNSAVSAARTKLMNLIGSTQTASRQKFLGLSIGELGVLGTTLSESYLAFKNHTDSISGVAPEDRTFSTQPIYGNVVFSNATVNIASNIISPNLSNLVYPTVNVGDVVTIGWAERSVIGKLYATVPVGTVSVLSSNTINISTDSINTLNLANLNLTAGMHVRVNGEFKVIQTVNALGDFITVRSGFRNPCSDEVFAKEYAIVTNTAFPVTLAVQSDLQINVKSELIANSLCLDTFITGVGTDFTKVLVPNNKIIYDNKEFYVKSVEPTRIEVDAPLRLLNNQPIKLVLNETALVRFSEMMTPDEILSTFDGLDQMTAAMGGNLTSDFYTSYIGFNGQPRRVDARYPTDVTRSLNQTRLMNNVSELLNDLADDLQDDAIRSFTDSQLSAYLEEKTNLVQGTINEINTIIQDDIAAFNAVKGLLSGLLKLFNVSCSKKKSSDGNTTSDDYLGLILAPDPKTQGCSATESDFISILDDIDREFKDPELPDRPFEPVEDEFRGEFENIDDKAPDFAEEEERNPGDDGDIGVGDDPNIDPYDDPCKKPC
jgi:hypothetical protein